MRFLLSPFRFLAKLVFPMFQGAPGALPSEGSGRAKTVLKWALHGLLLLLIMAALWYLAYRLHLERHIRVPSLILREAWLPLLFLLFYVLCWFGRSLWKLLGPEQVAADFPEIDRAWQEGLMSLGEAGIGVTETPLFLILGRPAGTERSLFNAGGLRLAVKQVPRRSDAPVALSGSSDAIFVSTPSTSLMGRYAGMLHGIQDDESSESAGNGATTAEPPAADLMPALVAIPGFGSLAEGTQTATATAEATATGGREERTATVERSRTLLLRDVEEVERLTARLRHVCQLIARDRRPFTPLNGILLVIPSAAGASDAASREVASLCQRDLESVREALQVECPIAALVCDLEQVPGFADFMSFYPEGQRKRFLGQQFPLVPDLDAAGKVRLVERGVQWVADNQFSSLIYKNWSPEPAGPTEVAPSASPNARLYRFLCELRERQKRIGRVLTRGVVMPTGGRAMLGACGFAATGRDLSREQGFAAGAFRWLIENQNSVAWTTEAVDVDSDFKRGTRLGYAGIGLLLAAVAILAYLLWPKGQ